LTSAEIGKAIGRSRRTVDSYIVDLRAATLMELYFKIFRMNYLGIPQERIALRLGQTRDIIRDHLGKKAELPKSPNADLKRGFTLHSTPFFAYTAQFFYYMITEPLAETHKTTLRALYIV